MLRPEIHKVTPRQISQKTDFGQYQALKVKTRRIIIDNLTLGLFAKIAADISSVQVSSRQSSVDMPTLGTVSI